MNYWHATVIINSGERSSLAFSYVLAPVGEDKEDVALKVARIAAATFCLVGSSAEQIEKVARDSVAGVVLRDSASFPVMGGVVAI